MSFFRWCMRHGARILFFVALIQVIVAIGGWLWSAFAGGRDWNVYSSSAPGENMLVQTSLLIVGIGSALLPFFGALVIDRLDRWLVLAKREDGE